MRPIHVVGGIPCRDYWSWRRQTLKLMERLLRDDGWEPDARDLLLHILNAEFYTDPDAYWTEDDARSMMAPYN